MLGALITLAFCVAMTSLGRLVLRRVGLWKTEELNDPALLLALSGLLALGMVGTLTLFIGFLPGGFRWGLVVCALLALVGVAGLVGPAGNLRPRLPQEMRGVGILHFAAISVAFLFALIGALAPSDVNDWDTLAYHLAVPKLWIQAGQITYIPFIHHSNFPFAVDNLYIWGLQWGGESGAKAFMVAYFGLGILAVFGFARQRYGPSAAPWAALVFATVPVVLWESGTAYIDVAHGVYAGVGVLLAALWAEHKGRQSALLWLAALHLGLAAGSKYTGLQTILAVGLVLVWLVLTRRDGSRPRIGPVLVAGAIALLLASPWYVKNAVVNGNPVYPFFYEVFGGRNWSSEHAAVYRDEQQTFGVGRHGAGRDWSALGHAVWGLAYQPGRYVNPGQTQG
ncbi:MAG TPA: phospholipid carrier-dependent glycosyltransferase, partial [Fimbriimonadaceae bacterium]|nr:phospholipid carrier-dependent glycosyltransferase [Fimbriimonadaceae bacterium]